MVLVAMAAATPTSPTEKTRRDVREREGERKRRGGEGRRDSIPHRRRRGKGGRLGFPARGVGEGGRADLTAARVDPRPWGEGEGSPGLAGGDDDDGGGWLGGWGIGERRRKRRASLPLFCWHSFAGWVGILAGMGGVLTMAHILLVRHTYLLAIAHSLGVRH
jgi:hypothetical protein